MVHIGEKAMLYFIFGLQFIICTCFFYPHMGANEKYFALSGSAVQNHKGLVCLATYCLHIDLHPFRMLYQVFLHNSIAQCDHITFYKYSFSQ